MERTFEKCRLLCFNDPSVTLANELARRNPVIGENHCFHREKFSKMYISTNKRVYLFDYHGGMISFVYSDGAVRKAKEIAKALGASDEGDEGKIRIAPPEG